MKKLAIAVTLATSIGILSAGTAHAASASSDASASIVAAIAISNTVPLSFGQIAPTAVIGTVTVPTTGVRTSSGGVTLGNAVAVPHSASSFNVTGAPDNTFTVTLPADGIVTLTSAALAPMAVNGFVSSPPATGAVTLSDQGLQTLLVGATLSVGVSQPAAVYSGTFNVTVVYN